MRRLGVVVVSVVSVGVLAGCSGPTEPPGLTASPTSSVSQAPTPDPTPTGVVETSDTELGIVFEDVPELSGDEAEVYNWIAVYEKEYWRMLTTNTVSPAFSVLASAEVQATMQRIAAENVATQSVIAGTFGSRISEIVVDGDAATGYACDDYRGTQLSDVNGPTTPEAIGWSEPVRKKLTLRRVPAEARWMIVTSEVQGTC